MICIMQDVPCLLTLKAILNMKNQLFRVNNDLRTLDLVWLQVFLGKFQDKNKTAKPLIGSKKIMEFWLQFSFLPQNEITWCFEPQRYFVYEVKHKNGLLTCSVSIV